MIRYLRSVVRQHPKKLLVLILLLLAGAGTGFRAYALHEWHLAQEAVKDNRPQDARKSLDFCLTVWPKDVQVHILAARSARLRGDFEDAEAHLNYCLKLAGGATDDVKLEFLLLRVQRGEIDDVLPDLLGYVERKHPEEQLVLQTMARVYMYNLRYRPAYQVLTRWIEDFPDCAQAYEWRGWVLERINNTPKDALKDYRRALELDENLVDVRLRLVEIDLDYSDTDAAQPHLDVLLKQAPDRPDVQARMGQWLYLKGRSDEARRYCEAAVKQLPDDSSLLLTLAKLDLDQAKRETSPGLVAECAARAEKWLRRILEHDPSDQPARLSLITCLNLQKRESEAKQALKLYEEYKALLARSDELLKQEADHPSQDPKPAFEIGDALMHIGQERLGVHWLSESWRRDPTYPPTNQALADYYDKKGDKAKASMHRRILNTPKARPPEPAQNTGVTTPPPKQ